MPSMKKYLKEHEEFMKRKISEDISLKELRYLKKFHMTRIGFMQHERLIHLLVTISFGFFLFIVLFGSLASGIVEIIPVVLLIFMMFALYMIHYYLLENGVQRWYLIADELDLKIKEHKEKKKG